MLYLRSFPKLQNCHNLINPIFPLECHVRSTEIINLKKKKNLFPCFLFFYFLFFPSISSNSHLQPLLLHHNFSSNSLFHHTSSRTSFNFLFVFWDHSFCFWFLSLFILTLWSILLKLDHRFYRLRFPIYHLDIPVNRCPHHRRRPLYSEPEEWGSRRSSETITPMELTSNPSPQLRFSLLLPAEMFITGSI